MLKVVVIIVFNELLHFFEYFYARQLNLILPIPHLIAFSHHLIQQVLDS